MISDIKRKVVNVSRHAAERACQRFPASFKAEDRSHINRVLTAIAFKGEKVGEAYVQHQEFRIGRVNGLRDRRPLVVVLSHTSTAGRVEFWEVVTVFTWKEFLGNGNRDKSAQIWLTPRVMELADAGD